MKFSLCIPQYNRIAFLLRALDIIARQTYSNIEVIVSDDGSTDDTEAQITALQAHYRFPLVYFRNPVNIGFDANVRKSLELGTGDYCMLLGNDDTLACEDAVERMVQFLEANNRPEIGFCNYFDEGNPAHIYRRASQTAVIGSGVQVAMKYYRSFSFVAGVLFRRDVFGQNNTDKVDGSIYVQMYLATRIISHHRFFMMEEAYVMKDIQMEGAMANSYRDTLMRSWKEYKPVDGGLPSVINVVCEGFKDAGEGSAGLYYRVIKDIYRYTFLYWLFDYRQNKAFVHSWALVRGFKPSVIKPMKWLNGWQRFKIYCWYLCSSVVGLITPVILFKKLKNRIYNFIKKAK